MSDLDPQIQDFSDQISVHFGSTSQNERKSDLKKSRICPIWGQSDPLWVQIWHPCTIITIVSVLLNLNTGRTVLETSEMSKRVSLIDWDIYLLGEAMGWMGEEEMGE